jgi:hypothetical protein
MRSIMPAVALAAALLAAPAWAQTQPQPGSGAGSGAGPLATPPTGSTTGGTRAMPPPANTTGGTAGMSMPGTGPTPRDTAPPTTATPAAGANSFTEGQARRRIEDAGYTQLRELRKDDQGVWRGRAMRNGAEADVGLDFQGRVVTGQAPAR